MARAVQEERRNEQAEEAIKADRGGKSTKEEGECSEQLDVDKRGQGTDGEEKGNESADEVTTGVQWERYCAWRTASTGADLTQPNSQLTTHWKIYSTAGKGEAYLQFQFNDVVCRLIREVTYRVHRKRARKSQ